MSRAIFLGASLALALASLSGVASAEQCRNASGKFIACPTSTAPVRCKDASGKFAKCSAPGATPIVASVKPPVKPTITPAIVMPPPKPSVAPAVTTMKAKTTAPKAKSP